MSTEKHIARARELFAELGDGDRTKATRRSMAYFLQEAGAGYDALDPTGQKSADEMYAEVERKTYDGNIAGARACFADLGVDRSRFGNTFPTLYTLRNNLAEVGASYDVLDPEGKTSAEEMEAEVNERVFWGYIDEARDAFDDIATSITPYNTISYMEDILNHAGVGYEALDPAWKKSAEEMKAEVEKRNLKGYIVEARYRFDGLREFGDPRRTLHVIKDRLKSAGVGIAALDPEGKKTAKEMAIILSKRLKKALKPKNIRAHRRMKRGCPSPAAG